MRWKMLFLLGATLGLLDRIVPAAGAAPGPARGAASRVAWVGTWGASPQLADEPRRVNGATIRELVRVSLGGERLRLRLSNAYGSEPVVIGATHLALHSPGAAAAGAAIVAGSDHAVRFHGAASVTIPAGGQVVSDPIEMTVPDLAELAISLYVPGNVVIRTEHALAYETTYISRRGDFTASAELVPAATSQALYFAADIEVVAPGAHAIVVLGDSLTDGVGSTAGAHRRWTDQLAQRLVAARDLPRTAVINEGIAGNRLLHDFLATGGLARLDRDVLVKSGARYVIVLEGLNDIGIPGAFKLAREAVTPDDIIAAHLQIIERAHALGLTVYGATLMPCEAAKMPGYASPAGEIARQAVNQWIRTSGSYDAVLDFEAVVRDPDHPTRLRPAFDSGDHLHPNDAGYQAIAAAIDLTLFR